MSEMERGGGGGGAPPAEDPANAPGGPPPSTPGDNQNAAPPPGDSSRPSSARPSSSRPSSSRSGRKRSSRRSATGRGRSGVGESAPPEGAPAGGKKEGDVCPDPQAKGEVCKDPDSRPPKPPPKKRSKFVEFMRKLFRRKRRKLEVCDCVPMSLLPAETESFLAEEELYEMACLRMQELLRKKRDKHELTPEELGWFTQQVALDRIEESQIGAMLMAMCINGLTPQETSALTEGIIASGDKLEWEESWVTVDKHSTGGVGDKVSLILAPALASVRCPCGHIKVPMLSGRGLGHTGGTLDKLESIPGFKVENSADDLRTSLAEAGCFIAGATSNIAPADSILYAIRDITSTADCLPLVVSSIVSKKVAAGSKLLVMDIKVGNAAFFKTVEEAKALAHEIVRVSGDLGVTVRVVLSKMENPIGKGIGNSLEVEDAIECMRGNGTSDVIELVAITGAVILMEKGFVKSLEEGKEAITATLYNGRALDSFRKMIISQGVDPQRAEDLCKGYFAEVLPTVPFSQITPIRVIKKGTIVSMNALELGTAVWRLGAGRISPDEAIDYRVGIWLTHTVGDEVDVGDVWAEVHHPEPDLAADIQKQIEDAIVIEKGATVDTTLVIEIM